MGRLGQKRGKGWYRYDEPRKPTPDPEVEALIRSLAADAGIAAADRSPTRRSSSARSSRWSTKARARSRPASPPRASDIDVIYVNGYGFPGWRGGPLFYADRRRPRRRCSTASAAFHREHGDALAAGAAARASCAERGGTFRERAIASGRGAADVSPAFEGRLRTPRMLPPDAIVSRDDRGRLRVRSPHALGPYPATLTDRLAHWAERAPDRTFLAARRRRRRLASA